MLKKLQTVDNETQAKDWTITQTKVNGSQPDDLVTSFRREGAAIVLGSVEPLSGTKFPERAYAALKSMTDVSHPRAKLVSDLNTIMAFARLPDGEKLEVKVSYKDSDVTRTAAVGIRGFWEIVDEEDVTKISLVRPKGCVINLTDAKITDFISTTDHACRHVLELAVTVEGHQRYAIKLTTPPLNSGESTSYAIKELRDGLRFETSVQEGKYQPLNLIDCPGRLAFQNKARHIHLAKN